jgi:transcriptional regulator with XRE-family HTH domain
MRELDRSLGASIRSVRVERGLTLREVAARTHGALRPSSIGSYERAERSLSVHSLVVLAEALGEAPESLLSAALALTEPTRSSVTIDLNLLPDVDVGKQVAAFAHTIRARRGDYVSRVVTLRAGDVEVIATRAGTAPTSVRHAIEQAVVASDRRQSPTTGRNAIASSR